MSEDSKVESVAITRLLKAHDLSLNAATIYIALIRAGILREVEYVSSSGSGEIKKFRQLTEKGIQYGENVETVSEIRTEPRFYPERFPKLFSMATDQIKKEADDLIGSEGE